VDPHSDFGATTQVLQVNLREAPRVLLVDDDELILERLATLIRVAGFEVDTALQGAAALAHLKRSFTPIVIADCRMPVMDGLTLCREIRRAQWPGYVYILLLTAQDSEEDILAGLDAGADDYLGKRASSAQLLARLRAATRVLSLEHSLKQALEEKRRLSLTDPLTGAANRRYFLRRLGHQLTHAQKSGGRVWLCSLDLDHFKRINDQYGHTAGDTVLETFVQRIKRHLRTTKDWCARLGGEEFVVILSGMDVNEAFRVAEAIRTTTAGEPVRTAAGQVPVTVSIGISGWETGVSSGAATVETLLQESDRALYASKETGRNRVTLASALRPR
jgi:two-component system cell cycle response regulator